MTAVVPRQRAGEEGFTLIEALVALALTGLVLSALGALTAQWLPNWNHGIDRVQQNDQVTIAMDRISADLASAAYVSRNREVRQPLFEGTELAVTFVRTALGPNAGPGLDVVRIAETVDRHEFATVRSRSTFGPLPIGSSLSEQVQFTDTVVLMRAPFRLSFAYAGVDRIWKSSWHDAKRLPAAIMLTVRETGSGRALPLSTVVTVHVDAAAPSTGGDTDPSKDRAPSKDGTADSARPDRAVNGQGGS
jgi:general secretion pathway protein J